MKLGKPIKYLAVEPSEVVERAKKLVREHAEESVNKLEELKTTDVLRELETLHTQGIEFIEPTDLSGAIRGRHNVYSHMETMIKDAKKSVTLVTTGKGLVRKAEALRSTLEKLKKKNVKIRVAADLNKSSMNAGRDLSKVAEVRHVNKLGARFCVVDGQNLMFMVMDDENVHPSYDIGVWVNTPFFANALESMFDMALKDMTPLDKVKE